MKLVVVESPTKVKTIGKYLGSGYKILASFGHVRDLPSKNGSIDTNNNFKMIYQVKDDSKKHVSAIVSAAKKSSEVLLATDPDREGESIAWNIAEILKEQKAIDPKKMSRISFTEITPKAINNAIKHPRNIDINLVDAQQARLSLDYLVGFNISPILWRKLPGSRSAGRVQSVALRLIVEREKEIKSFNPKEYWTVDAILSADKDIDINAKVIIHRGKKFGKDYPSKKEEAILIEKEIKEAKFFNVAEIKDKLFKQNPTPPFITSSLQQSAFQAYSFTSKKTMQLAQRLYEGIEIGNKTVGLITYMRTDGFGMSDDAVKDIRSCIEKDFGKEFLPPVAIRYKTKVKNAQEAHECIRPTDITITPSIAQKYLPHDELKLYNMIWCRAVACQMVPARKITKTIKFYIKETETYATLAQTIIQFAGFLQVYKNLKQDNDNIVDDLNFSLPDFKEGANIPIIDTSSKQHFTVPPPRFNEASLIKQMEELGIGRPSTYSSIVNIIQDRGYVELKNKQFYASLLGMIVTSFLKSFTSQYIEYDFTALLEEKLDDIASGNFNRTEVLDDFWKPFTKCIGLCEKLDYNEVSEALTNDLKKYLFHINESGDADNTCQKCKTGSMLVHSGRFGPYLRCSKYPECENTIKLIIEDDGYAINDITHKQEEEVGIESDGKIMRLKKGPYGKYIEVVEGEKKYNKAIPKDDTEITEEKIIFYGNLPRKIDSIELGEDILVGVGRFGPFVQAGVTYASIKTDQIGSVTEEEAIDLITKKRAKVEARGGGRFSKYSKGKASSKAKASSKSSVIAKNVTTKKKSSTVKKTVIRKAVKSTGATAKTKAKSKV